MTKAQQLLKKYPFPHPRVMNGALVFRLVDTYGLPLEMVILRVQKACFFIDWPDFAKMAISSGWGEGRIIECLKLANSYYTKKWVEKTYIRGGNV